MGKHRDRSRSPRDSRHHNDSDDGRRRRHSSPEKYRKHQHRGNDAGHSRSKWDESPSERDSSRYERRRSSRDRSRERGRKYEGTSRGYERERERNRERKMKRYRDDKDDGNYEWGSKANLKQTKGNDKDDPDNKEKEKPNFGLSGKLAEDTNKFNGVVIKYTEPEEARIPKRRWRLYPFKGEKSLPTLYIHRQSAYLVGRDRKVCDLPVDHPSCSKQHAALQYRLMPYEKADGSEGKRVLPYVIDLGSANGTFLNNKQIEARKYYQLMEKDVVKFGFSTREYVVLHESSKDESEDDGESVTVKEEKVD